MWNELKAITVSENKSPVESVLHISRRTYRTAPLVAPGREGRPEGDALFTVYAFPLCIICTVLSSQKTSLLSLPLALPGLMERLGFLAVSLPPLPVVWGSGGAHVSALLTRLRALPEDSTGASSLTCGVQNSCPGMFSAQFKLTPPHSPEHSANCLLKKIYFKIFLQITYFKKSGLLRCNWHTLKHTLLKRS